MRIAKILRVLRVLGEAVVATVFFVVFAGLLWAYFGIHRHLLPMAANGHGFYGQVEDAGRLVPGTKIIKFEAVYVPSRILWLQIPFKHFEWTALPWPVPEVVEVHVEYQRPGQKPEEFDRTYLLACDSGEGKSRKDCLVLYRLIGIKLYGKGIDADGKGSEFTWVYLRGQLMPSAPAPCPAPDTKGNQPIKPATPSPAPPKKPQALPSGVQIAQYPCLFITGGGFLYL